MTGRAWLSQLCRSHVQRELTRQRLADAPPEVIVRTVDREQVVNRRAAIAREHERNRA